MKWKFPLRKTVELLNFQYQGSRRKRNNPVNWMFYILRYANYKGFIVRIDFFIINITRCACVLRRGRNRKKFNFHVKGGDLRVYLHDVPLFRRGKSRDIIHFYELGVTRTSILSMEMKWKRRDSSSIFCTEKMGKFTTTIPLR